MTISTNEYTLFDNAYKFFNEKMFANNLPECLITFQRKKTASGYFSFERFCSRDNLDNRISEIALNPDTFENFNDTEVIAILVHEMIHLWQFYLGDRPEKQSHHDRQWGDMMENMGLMPSSTFYEGGRKTGKKVGHWIIPNGKFEKYCAEFLQDKKINWQNVPIIEKEKKTRERKSKLKYICPDCEKIAWQKVESKLICGECNLEMEEQVL